MCKKAIEEKSEILVKLPEKPFGWSEKKLLERLYQLAHLVKLNNCILSRIDESDVFKIYARPDNDVTS